MKKSFTTSTLVIAGLLFLSIPALQAQDAQKEGFNSSSRFGIRGGVVISNQNFEEGMLNEDPQSKFGADLAILATLPIGNGFFNIQPELHWMQKGSTISDINGDDITNTMNYLELPVLARFNFGGSLKLFAFAGPSAGYLLSVNSDNDYLKKDDFEDIEFGAHIGAGVGIGTFEVDIRYMAGLSDIADSNGDLGEIKNSSFGAGLTLKF